MRLFMAAVLVTFCAPACAQPQDPPSPAAPRAGAAVGTVDPARIDRSRAGLPPGYEVADISGRVAPLTLWGFGPGWAADPARCAALGDPVRDPATARGWSGSGPGGIVFAIVAQGLPMDPALVDECARWTVSAGHTSGTVTMLDAPPLDQTDAVAMTTAATTVVEGGTETRSHADTAIAYLGDHVAIVAIITDPGSPDPPLGRDFAAALLATTVSALRG